MSTIEILCTENKLEFWCNEVKKRGYKIMEVIHKPKDKAKIIACYNN